MIGAFVGQAAAIAGLLLLLLLAARVWAHHRRANDELVAAGRGTLAGAIGLSLAVPLLMAWSFAIAIANDGDRTVREGRADVEAPARARVFLRAIQVAMARTDEPSITVGFSPTAGLALPRHYGVAEAYQRRDLFTVVAKGKRRMAIEPLVDASSSTRVVVVDDPASIGRSGCPASAASETRECTGDECSVVICNGTAPKAALVFKQELVSADVPLVDVPLQVSPWVWSARGWRRHHLQLEAGELFQIGATTDALPGLTIWEVPAPSARPALMFPPDDLLGACSEWVGLESEGAGGFFYHPSLGGAVADRAEDNDDFSCFLPFAATQPFALEVRRLVPDVSGVGTRSLWTALYLAAPAFLWLLWLFASRPSRRTLGRCAPAIALAALSACFVAVAVVRLLWGHRLDMLRDYEAVGVRVIDNQMLVVFTGAMLAMKACLLAIAGRWKWLAGGLAWTAMAGLGIYAVAVNVPAVEPTRIAAYAAISVVIASLAAVDDILLPLSGALRGAFGSKTRWLPVAAMAGVFALVASAAALDLSLVIVKLALAAAVVSCFYLTLRHTTVRGDSLASMVVVVLAGCALAALAAVDTGVATLYGSVGVLIALVVAGFDALHADVDRGRIAHYGAWLHPVVLAGSIVVITGCLVVILLSLFPTWLSGPGPVTATVLGFFGLVPVLFAGMATLVWRRNGTAAAGPWLVAGACTFVGWLMRPAVIDLVVGSQREAAKRIAAVLDPAYAILKDDAAFSRSLTAWREASLVGPDNVADATDFLSGQGFFGAQVLDPGVLLSVDNDYLPVLMVRELGALGLALMVAVIVVAVAGALVVARARMPSASAGSRWRTVAALVALIAIWYQPVASLGGLPFTGVSLLGLGIDSPSDWWAFVALLAFLSVWGLRREVPDDEQPDDESPRRSIWPRLAVAFLCVAIVVSAGRAAVFALGRPAPVAVASVHDDGQAPRVEFTRGFEPLVDALEYAFRIQCPEEARDVSSGEQAIPPKLLTAKAETTGVRRFDAELRRAWKDERGDAIAAAGRFMHSGISECKGRYGHWRLDREEGIDNRCSMTFDYGWPDVQVEIVRDSKGSTATCRARVDEAVLRTLRYPVKRPFAGARVRLVSRAMGAAATDVAELVAGNVILRMRPGAGEVDVSDARGGIYYASRARLGEGLTVSVDAVAEHAVLERSSQPGARPATLLTYEGASTRIYAFEPERARWQARKLAGSEQPTPLSRLAVIVTGAKRGRTVWLYRRATAWPGSNAGAVVDPLLADDVATVLGSNRRFYLYGGLLPELGWVNPWTDRKSLGLDGWVRAALSTYSQELRGEGGRTRHRRRWERYVTRQCPAVVPPTEDDFDSVCTRSPLDGVLECRVSLQPELSVRLRHLLELVSLVPNKFVKGKAKWRPAISSSLALMRGDTGEILAQTHFVAGREATAYAPATPSLEKYLIDVREDRDPSSGRRLPIPEEAGAEKVGWNRPIAIGSVLKPLIARAAERVDRDWLSNLHMGTELRMKKCKSGVNPVLGYCPRTASLWNSPAAVADTTDYLGKSLNWFQAGLGILATGLGGEISIDTSVLVQVGGHLPASPVWTAVGGREVIGAKGLDLGALDRAPMWQQLESLVGRRRCSGPDKKACLIAESRRDMCAARGLPLESPSRDLRHLVALGPGAFDFYPEGRYRGGRVPVVEYLEFLRGSGAHPLGSLLQVADAYARVFFSPMDEKQPGLAASWFPLKGAGVLPASCSGSPASPTLRGMCRTLASGGTASALGQRLRDLDVVAFGAKTGTIDSLGDIVESKVACERFNVNHTVPGSSKQPYHLDCSGKKQSVSDSLLVVGFAVKHEGALVPLVLALRFQGVGGSGFATRVADLFVEEAAAFLRPPAPR